MKNRSSIFLLTAAFAGAVLLNACTGNSKKSTAENTDSSKTAGVATASAGLTLPEGFNAAILAEDLGGTRHIAVSSQGDIFVKLGKPKDGKGILVLHENNGKAEVKNGFGDYEGTGIYIKNGYLYTSSNEDVYRYKLNDKNEVIDPAKRETVVKGLLNRNQHEAKAIVLDDASNLYVNIGAYSNSCQIKDREKGSLGQPGCPILDSAGGIWQFKADKLNQTYKDGVRYATGLRNVVGMDWNKQNNQLFVMQHGRDALHDIFPDMFDTKQSAILPAECMYAIKKGDNAGWPYIYYDQEQRKKILAPEYGGDGKKDGDPTHKFINPAAAYPGHLAPNGLLFYTGDQFPEKYKNGAFIAFHGSWNRAPEPQAGYFVVFQPFKDGKPDGKWEVFADGFSGSPENTAKGSAVRRPCGLAQGPDGSIYVTDDSKGTIYKISYKK
ncbi:PQQ-dependent sugar dehydrogenase [Mucilaginibacter aquariorum]|uniref:PQQ-dependent sugar dehydrogenase n=1 Tax=Mucilaginibacter aquariorum TaxID=2967225 RepID=A0ABT1SWG6_9SPHI|nr:PQQ-dependent sugar dehydrogenase [Mucilaginibacter aquariorum]MCQ6956696.1 PQQ-dependent sugar dehydrogenase [Mucilaginibacter aquariorum]